MRLAKADLASRKNYGTNQRTQTARRRLRPYRRRAFGKDRQDQAMRRRRKGWSPIQLRRNGRRRRRQRQSRLGLRKGERSAAERRKGPQGRHAQYGHHHTRRQNHLARG